MSEHVLRYSKQVDLLELATFGLRIYDSSYSDMRPLKASELMIHTRPIPRLTRHNRLLAVSYSSRASDYRVTILDPA